MNITAQIAPIRRLTATVGGIAKSGGKSDHQIIEAGMAPDAITLVPTVGTVTGGIRDLSGAPPLTFQTAANRLYDYVIYGAQNGVGDYVGEPIYDGEIEQGSIRITDGEPFDRDDPDRLRSTHFMETPAGDYYVSAVKTASALSYSVFFWGYMYDVSSEAYMGSISNSWITLPATITIPQNCKLKFIMAYAYVSNIYPEHIESVTIVPAGADAPTITDGYAIPVTVAGNTVTFSIDKPLGVGETLSLSDTGTDIPTQANASNTLSVGTGVAPAEVYIRYKT